jgi:hypothetical protein
MRRATRKRILRAALNEIVVRKEGAFINMVLRWRGGAQRRRLGRSHGGDLAL